jgi:thiol-disulfide isomerase/thioredoxin
VRRHRYFHLHQLTEASVQTTTLIVHLVLALVFLLAGATKLHDRTGTREALVGFGVPASLAAPLAIVLPLAELAVAFALLLPQASPWGVVGALALLLLFTTAITVNLARGRRPDCHCFGQLHAEPIGWRTLALNVALVALAGLATWSGWDRPGPDPVGWVGSLTPGERAGVAMGILTLGILAMMAWLLAQMLAQQGRLLLRLDGLEVRLAEAGVASPAPIAGQRTQGPSPGLPIGSPAPGFSLPDLDSRSRTLDELRLAGKPVLLVFSDPGCGPCATLLPEIGRWARAHADVAAATLVSRGTAEANRAKAAEHGLAPVLLQRDYEVATTYRALMTPSAVLVRPDGTVGSDVHAGADQIRALLDRLAQEGAAGPLRQLAPTQVRRLPGTAGGGRPGLEPGTPAPPMRLPDLEGQVRDRAELAGNRDTVVLFWDPGCVHCRRMLPALRAWEADRPAGAPGLIVVASGSPEANRAMSLASPILLDPSSATSGRFGAGGTPMAVQIDADGRVGSGLAVGAQAVLRLLRGQSSELRLAAASDGRAA